MNQERYDYKISLDHMEYNFYSEGPKGRIKKIVRFQPFTNDAGDFFNLVFGEPYETSKSINDSVISNNLDRDKILTTVAHIVMDFTTIFPNVEVYASGRTPSRNRLYRMGINRQYPAISQMFEISGVTKDNEIEPFVKGIDYVAFIVQRKLYKRRH